jgi:hypothetical protein
MKNLIGLMVLALVVMVLPLHLFADGRPGMHIRAKHNPNGFVKYIPPKERAVDHYYYYNRPTHGHIRNHWRSFDHR